MTKILKVSTQGGTKTAKVRPKKQSCTVGHQNNKSININNNKNNKGDNAGQNPANLMKFKLKNAKITFLHQKKHIKSSNNIFTESHDFEAKSSNLNKDTNKEIHVHVFSPNHQT